MKKSAPMDDDFESFMGEIGELEAAAAAPAAASADASDEIPLSFLSAAVPAPAVKKPVATTIAKPAARVPAGPSLPPVGPGGSRVLLATS